MRVLGGTLEGRQNMWVGREIGSLAMGLWPRGSPVVEEEHA